MAEYEVIIILRIPNLTDALGAIDHANSFPNVKFVEAEVKLVAD
jgi:hypothetical protein